MPHGRLLTCLIKSNFPLMIRKVKGEGMYPTLEKGQMVVVWKRAKLQVGDIVVFIRDGAEKVKRVSGVEGDFLYVVGDNPRFSHDSRQYGYVARDTVIGRVIYPSDRS